MSDRCGTLFAIAFLIATAFSQGGSRLETIVVEAEGVAELRSPREQAIRGATRSALQQAVESACGVRLARFEVGRDGELRREAQLAFAQGIVLRWQRLGEPRIADGCVFVRVQAEVAPLDQLQTPADWREVWQTVGHPPLALHIRYLGEPAMETHTRSALKAALLESLREMGVRLSPHVNADGWQLIAEIQVEPLKRWGDPDAPYGLGDLFASWQARLLLQVAPPSKTRLDGRNTIASNGGRGSRQAEIGGRGSAEPITDGRSAVAPLVLLLRRDAKAVSLTSDQEAVQRAVRKAALEPHADWRITLATLWLDQILDLSDSPDRSDGSDRLRSTNLKEVRNHAKSDSNKPAVSANGKRPAQRSKRR